MSLYTSTHYAQPVPTFFYPKAHRTPSLPRDSALALPSAVTFFCLIFAWIAASSSSDFRLNVSLTTQTKVANQTSSHHIFIPCTAM